MSTDMNNRAEVEDRLWKEIAKGHFSMLGLVGPTFGEHFQPMNAFCEPKDGLIWFFTSADTDLAAAVASGAEAMFVFQSKDQDVQACIGGELVQSHDRERIERYWNPVVAAWYPDGKDDPKLTVLRMRAIDAQVWISQGGPVKFAWEIAKANATHKEPDLGGRASVTLGSSAAP